MAMICVCDRGSCERLEYEYAVEVMSDLASKKFVSGLDLGAALGPECGPGICVRPWDLCAVFRSVSSLDL
jgi:hypothetical protein